MENKANEACKKNKTISQAVISCASSIREAFTIEELESLAHRLSAPDGLKIVQNELRKRCSKEETMKVFDTNETFKMLVILTSFQIKTHTNRANSILLLLAKHSAPGNLKLIFKTLHISKNNINDDMIKTLKKYLFVPELNRTIAGIFEKCGISCKEALVYSIDELKESYIQTHNKNANTLIKDFFSLINTREFKKIRSVFIKLPFHRYLDCLPDLNETGIRNLMELKKGSAGIKDSKEYGTLKSILRGRTNSASEFLRIEWLKEVSDHCGIHDFFRINQYFYDLDNQKLILKIIKEEKMAALKENVTKFIENIVAKMCESKSPIRRLFGVSLLHTIGSCNNSNRHILNSIKHNININRLIFDTSFEIRKSAEEIFKLLQNNHLDLSSDLEKLTLETPEKHKCYEKQVSKEKHKCDEEQVPNEKHEYNEDQVPNENQEYSAYFVEGNAFLLQNKTSNELVAMLNGKPESNSKEFICPVIRALVMKENLANGTDALIEKILLNNSDCDEKWQIVAECCGYFYHRKNTASDALRCEYFNMILMRTLLESDHLGLISHIKDYVSSKDIRTKGIFEKYLKMGITRLIDKEKNSRKSGGLSIYFTVLSSAVIQGQGDNNSFALNEIKKRLNKILGISSTEDSIAALNYTDESAAFHCLNVYRAMIDEQQPQNIEFYLSVAFAALKGYAFNIVNCGCAIFAALFKKIHVKYVSFDVLLVLEGNLRSFLYKNLKSSVETKEKLLSYFLLFIFERITGLSQDERNLIEKCRAFGEFNSLKANSLLKNDMLLKDNTFIKKEKPLNMPVHVLKIREDATEIETCAILLDILRNENLTDAERAATERYLTKNLKIETEKNVSAEFMRHLICRMAISKKINKDLAALILKSDTSDSDIQYDIDNLRADF
ncbi:hypothetical protein ENBRE01_2598 [Enteropsectra breve]|nr:hypothetical protein ENBRE01_2598 [Enteropsectra breve]